MKILCLGDSHLDNETLDKITKKYPSMDLYIHCGDSDMESSNPLLKGYHVVKGNHDFSDFSDILHIKAGKSNILVTHGHLFNIYDGYDRILKYMNEHNLDICFHGHTHVPAITNIDDKLIVNPGSTMINRGSYGYGTYTIITIENDNININYYHHKTHEKCNEVLIDGKKTLAELIALHKEKKAR